MHKVRTFSTELKIFHTAHELTDLDKAVNDFLASGDVSRVVSVSDTATTDASGATIGLIRVVAYEEGK